MLAYALLRWRGVSEDQALELIGAMRPETREGLRDEHFAWGDQVARDAGP
jgi:hypothetical protein